MRDGKPVCKMRRRKIEYLVPRDQASDLLERTGSRLNGMLSALVERGVDPGTPFPHLEWTVGDLAVHLTQTIEHSEELLEGTSSPFTDIQHIASVNAELLAQRPDRDIERARHQFSEAVRRLRERFREMPDDYQVTFYHGSKFTPAQAMVMMASEMLVHGWDLAQVTREEYEIDPADARLILYAVTPLMPRMVDAEQAAGLTATYEVRIRDGVTFRLHFADGALNVSHVEPGGVADCRISAEAPGFLLLGYGRGSQIAPLLTGKVFAWGRKPWLAARFTSLVKNP